MMRNSSFSLSCFLVLAGAALTAQAPAIAPRAYDPAAEVTLGGVIAGVVATNASDGTVGVHLQLTTARNTVVKVHLGPAMFIGMNDASFFADDQVLVTGAFVAHGGEVALWARTVTKNNKTLILRNPDGAQRWPLATADDPDGCGVSHAPVRF
jgi:hypothetical protein